LLARMATTENESPAYLENELSEQEALEIAADRTCQTMSRLGIIAADFRFYIVL